MSLPTAPASLASPYAPHPAAAVFPMLSDADLAPLAADIAAHGLIHPIQLLGNRIIDGRNRLRACELAQVAPRFEEVTVTDPVRYVIAANIHRRHLTTAQRAAIAAELANLGRGGNNNPSGINQHGGQKEVKGQNCPLTDTPPITIAEAAALMGVGTTSVKNAKATMRDDPDAHVAAKRGEKPRPLPTPPPPAPRARSPEEQAAWDETLAECSRMIAEFARKQQDEERIDRELNARLPELAEMGMLAKQALKVLKELDMQLHKAPNLPTRHITWLDVEFYVNSISNYLKEKCL